MKGFIQVPRPMLKRGEEKVKKTSTSCRFESILRERMVIWRSWAVRKEGEEEGDLRDLEGAEEGSGASSLARQIARS